MENQKKENQQSTKKSKAKKATASVILVIAILLIPIALVLSAGFLLPDQYINTFNAELPDKVHWLDSISKPKVVVIGGSSVAFALDSVLLEEKIHMPVVNFGLYASLGTRAMVELSRDAIKKGDIIILSPETDEQTLSMYFGAETMWQATEADRSIIKRLPSDMKKEMALNFWSYASNKCRLWTSGTPDPEGVYRKDSFNEYGDIIYDRPQSKMKLGYDASKKINPVPEIVSDEFVELLNEYTSFVRSKGAEVYFTFAPMNKAALEDTVGDAELYDYFLYLSSALDCEIIGNINNSIMKAGYFYDSNFHLNDSGKTVWTVNLARDLMRTCGTVESISIELPEPPALPSDDTDTREDENCVYFTFREIKNDSGLVVWYSVLGLSDQGKTQSSLTVPRAYNKIPVHSIDKDAFSGSSALKEITINDNIYSIESGAFAGAPSLKVLHIYNDDASSMTVDQISLFDGASDDIKIYLYSKQSYVSYVAGYFWANYSNRMVPKY